MNFINIWQMNFGRLALMLSAGNMPTTLIARRASVGISITQDLMIDHCKPALFEGGGRLTMNRHDLTAI